MYTFLIALFAGFAILSLIFRKNWKKMRIVIIVGSAIISFLVVSTTSIINYDTLETTDVFGEKFILGNYTRYDSSLVYRVDTIRTDTSEMYMKTFVGRRFSEYKKKELDSLHYEQKRFCTDYHIKIIECDTIFDDTDTTLKYKLKILYSDNTGGSFYSKDGDDILVIQIHDTISEPYIQNEYTQSIGTDWIDAFPIPITNDIYVLHLDSSYRKQLEKTNFKLR